MVRFDRHMSEAEGLLWRLERDPYLSANVANVTILDRPLDVGRFTRRMERVTQLVPRLREKVQPAPVNLSPPSWVEDAGFDLEYHIRHIALPAPGTMRQLLDLAVLYAADPLERSRPQWEFLVVDGLEDGRAAMIQKFHHTLVDGEAGIRLMAHFLDLERDAADPPPPPEDEVPHAEPVPVMTPSEALREVVASGLRMPIGAFRQIADLLADPSRIPSATAAAFTVVRDTLVQLSDTERARSPLWTIRSLKRRLDVLRTPIEPTKKAAKTLEGTLNTAFLTVAAAAAGRYHAELGAPIEHLRASMAISTRTDESGPNAYTLARMLVPTGEMPIAERFTLIAEEAETARVGSATANLDSLAALAAALPVSLVTRLARQQTQTVDFATSNVRGAPFPVYVAGAKVLENYPVGPLAGVAFNLTLLSYDGSLDIGLHSDPLAIEHPELLRDLLDSAFEELVEATA
jgi:WS/DGAT/MGAT family acyltransferase